MLRKASRDSFKRRETFDGLPQGLSSDFPTAQGADNRFREYSISLSISSKLCPSTHEIIRDSEIIVLLDLTASIAPPHYQ